MLSGLEKLLLLRISFEMCDKTPMVEHLNLSSRQLARANFKSLHQQHVHGIETMWSLLKLESILKAFIEKITFNVICILYTQKPMTELRG